MSFIYFKDQQISKTSFYQQFKDDIFLENHETSQLPRLIGGRLGQSEPGFTLQSRGGRERRRSAVSAAHQCQLQQFRKTTKIHSKTITTPKLFYFYLITQWVVFICFTFKGKRQFHGEKALNFSLF